MSKKAAKITPYDTLAYPSMIFRQCQPDRLAVIARLHRIAAPDVATARMLEIGGGDGLNAMALAAAFPHAAFVNFDIAAQPIARGHALAGAAGQGNVRHLVLDILEAADRLDGPFDYVVAHGVYAWVPEPVRAAVLALIGRLLSPNGVAFVSYNALPGGHSRMALREMMLHHIAHLAAPDERLASARQMLRDFVEPRDDDEPIVAAMRREAEATLGQPDGLLFHDELGEIYSPQSLSQVVKSASAHGLRYLGDAGSRGFAQALSADDGEGDAAFLNRLQAEDYVAGRYFRASLFIRGEVALRRPPSIDALADMWVSAGDFSVEGLMLKAKGVEVDLKADVLAAALRRLQEAHPGRLRVAGLLDEADHRIALLQLASEGLIDLHTIAAPFSLQSEDRPRTSALARAQITLGETRLATLDHRLIEMADPGARAFVTLLDGMSDRGQLEAAWSASRWSSTVHFDDALQAVLRAALIEHS